MAHGLPTIGFASCPGTNELIIHEKNGLLVNGDDRIHDFSEGLKTLMSNPDLRNNLGQQGLITIEQFHPDAIVKQWEELMKSVHYERLR